jgi:hypothetical protein
MHRRSLFKLLVAAPVAAVAAKFWEGTQIPRPEAPTLDQQPISLYDRGGRLCGIVHPQTYRDLQLGALTQPEVLKAIDDAGYEVDYAEWQKIALSSAGWKP